MNIPPLGFGTWKLSGDIAAKSVSTALEVGYRHIDTADRYGNHREVGQAIKSSGLKREELFVTTKVFFDELHYQQILDNANRYLEELQIDYIDLLLVHWPNKNISLTETFDAMTKVKEDKIVKHIGVSNFTIHHIEDVLSKGYEIENNQVELHPTFNQTELVEFCETKNIKVTAYSPLGMGDELKNDVVLKLAEKYTVSPAQVILNWIMARGIVAIPKSSNPDNIRDNFNSQNWKMEVGDIALMNEIPQKPRLLSPPWNEFDY